MTASIPLDSPDPDTERPEFRAFTWMHLDAFLDRAVSFRRALYEAVVEYIRSLPSPRPSGSI